MRARFAAATEALAGVVDDSDVVDALTEPLSESREATQYFYNLRLKLGPIIYSPQYNTSSNLCV